MSSLVFLVPLALLLGAAALAAFFWSLRNGQYDDLEGAGARIFVDETGDRADAPHSPLTAEATSTTNNKD
ncbi:MULTISPECIES: cbb3-type cytochrome oxidase assembly protein CcoS [unclassified Beijerinckia]|uniref:cbb3-type cytochrome oxidase assembly protein CcoS n=1 Tax=unclassified Beijerinckia TaxID=2638183 RepID=UPI0008960F7E|nr:MULTISPECIES: cbb3-type cytochrome oxidase assembly protein CcoS [unclassified Beijerinckia]MDH7799193.1 cbb3-type cytochrome oxidase maturation protein [Beijerinckia sp. GAS462]SED92391.1 cytochrome oxidase maturation protein, cbb3-type [Beijerinckia sp. 28-YEA-48]